MKVLFLTRYDRLGASSRLRSYQYIPLLEKNGVEVAVHPLLGKTYLGGKYTGKSRIISVVRSFAERISLLIKERKNIDVIWLEKEIFPWFPWFFEKFFALTGIPYVVDYDDAIFHRYDRHRNWFVRLLLGKKIESLMRSAAAIVVGNEYLGSYAKAAGCKNIFIVPTVIDLDRYSVKNNADNGDVIVIGWIGSPSTTKYLKEVSSSVRSLARKYPVKFVAVGGVSEQVISYGFEPEEWTESGEVESILKFDIGIMPLPNLDWERGKCGYKLIQYMACGIPVVASPVGVNESIVINGGCGFLARTSMEWDVALTELIQNKELRVKLGSNGRRAVENGYCIQKTGQEILGILQDVVSARIKAIQRC